MSGANGAANEATRVLFPKTQLLDVVTKAIVDDPEVLSSMRVTLAPDDDPDQVFEIVLESVIQAHLLDAAGQFKSENYRERDAVILSQQILEQCNPNPFIKKAICNRPYRSIEYPRKYAGHKWVEPSCVDELGLEVENPQYLSAPFEMVIFLDPKKVFYKFLPIKLTTQADGVRYFDISGTFSFADTDCVHAIPVRRCRKALDLSPEVPQH